MTETGVVRRNRVSEGRALAIAAGSGALAVVAGAEPTGSPVIDAVLVVAAIGVVTWASASAPWWALATACGVAAVTAFDPLLIVVAAIGFAVSLAVGVRRRDDAELRAVLGAVAMNVLLRSDLDGFLGASAVVGVAVGALLFVAGVLRRRRAVRRAVWIACGAVVTAAAVSLALLTVAGVTARPDVSEGSNVALQAIDTLNTGDYTAAADAFDRASVSFDRAADAVGGPLARPSSIVPGVAQNVRAGRELAAEAAAATSAAADALRSIDPSTLTVVDGAIDLDAISAVSAPLDQVRGALDDLRTATDDVASPWLVAPLQTELAELRERLDENEPRLDNAADAVRLAPAMLGAEGERRYLVLFTTPAEARGLGGFSGNYAEVSVDDGRIAVERFGRTNDLNVAAREGGARCDDCPDEYIARYGRTGLTNGPDGAVGQAAWSNLPFGAHFPYIAETAQVLYPQSGGSPVDGVLVMDPYVVEALLRYTGPIDVPELGVVVQPESAAEFILRDQYLLAEDRGVRVEALDTLGTSAITALLSGNLPEPADLARDLGPLIAERRLLLWTDDEAEQDLLASTGLDGAIPGLGDAGGFSVSVNNTGENKIDVYLDREVEATVETTAGGDRRLVVDVTLGNRAPSSGLPRYVIGNSFGLPDGTNRMFLTFYGPLGLLEATRDGEPTTLTPMTEAGWIAYGLEDEIPPGEVVTYHLEFELPAIEGGAAAPEGPVLWHQPLARRE
jgi:hypothetical protein